MRKAFLMCAILRVETGLRVARVVHETTGKTSDGDPAVGRAMHSENVVPYQEDRRELYMLYTTDWHCAVVQTRVGGCGDGGRLWVV